MRYYLVFVFSFFGFIAHAADPGFRLFTDPQGREMQAKLTVVSGDDVFIERQDGLATKVDISIFSKEDQAYIRDWEKKAAWKKDIELVFRSHVTERSGWDGSSILRKTWKEGYEVTIKNNTAFEMEDVRIKYMVLKFEDAIAAQKRSEGEIKKLKGSAEVGKIPAWSDGATETSQFPMQQTKLAPRTRWASGGKETSKDKMEGIWVRVFVGDFMATEITKPENLDRKIGWD
ncbi:MAG: hypothetical protein GVY36_04235 [Verrucomicrobia bacterium]|jgi:hypothetical protein|nr:hypothetical protein [Verrucomicrobiota bacterium]